MRKEAISLTLLVLGVYVSTLSYAQSSNAYVIVDIAPSEVNKLGAAWTLKEINGLGWLESGYMLALSASIHETNYTVTFRPDIFGWKAPDDIEITIESGKVSKVVGIYEQEMGALQVNIYPVNAVQAGAKWRREGQETWRESGEIEQNIPFGVYTIEFYKLNNWDSPKEIEVQIKDKTLVSVNAYYTQHLGSLQVSISPQEAIDAGAKWKIQGKTDWLDSGFKYENLPVGTYTVEFKDIPNWQTPSQLQVSVEKDQTAILIAEYVKSISEGVDEGEGGTTEGEGEGEGESTIWSRCGCDNSDSGKSVRNFLMDILFIGLMITITALSRYKSSKNSSD